MLSPIIARRHRADRRYGRSRWTAGSGRDRSPTERIQDHRSRGTKAAGSVRNTVRPEHMLERLAKLKLPRDRVGVALVLWRAAMIIATAVTWVFSYLAAFA